MLRSTIFLFYITISSCLSELPQELQDETYKTVPEIIEKYKYKAESHKIITEDQYILTVHRIVNSKKNKGTVLLIHGTLGSSADFIITGPKNALGFLLANEGYDVWIGNLRGNFYSRNHTKLPVNEREFWNFSWHEIALFDVPATIDYILEKTGEKQIFYIGHSQGTHVYYIMCAVKPEYNSKIRAQFSMAPVAYLRHLRSPIIKTLALFSTFEKFFIDALQFYEFLPLNGTMTNFYTKFLCNNYLTICKDIIFLICGFDSDQMNTKLLPLILSHIPAGTSMKLIYHYSQQINSGTLQQYDYGVIKNLQIYKSITPPGYNLSKVTSPIYFHYSKNDWISTPSDVETLYSKLGNVRGKFIVPFRKFNHMDFVFGMDAPEVLYKKIISLMARH